MPSLSARAQRMSTFYFKYHSPPLDSLRADCSRLSAFSSRLSPLFAALGRGHVLEGTTLLSVEHVPFLDLVRSLHTVPLLSEPAPHFVGDAAPT